MVLACNILFSFSIIYALYDLMSSMLCLAVQFLKISFSQLYIIVSTSYKVVIYLKNFCVWLVDPDTGGHSYTIPKINELCRERLITVLLDYESAYLGLAGEVVHSPDVSFIRGIVCYPHSQLRSVCVWARTCVLEFLCASLWMCKSLLNAIVTHTFLQDVYLHYPIDWIPIVYAYRL